MNPEDAKMTYFALTWSLLAAGITVSAIGNVYVIKPLGILGLVIILIDGGIQVGRWFTKKQFGVKD